MKDNKSKLIMKTLSYDELSVRNCYIKFIINQAKFFQLKGGEVTINLQVLFKCIS